MPARTFPTTKHRLSKALLVATFVCAAMVFAARSTQAYAEPSTRHVSSDLTFVYISSQTAVLSDDQYVVVGFDRPIANARLVVRDLGTDQRLLFDAEKTDESGAALFSISSDKPATLQIVSVRYLVEGDQNWSEQSLETSERSTSGTMSIVETSETSDSGHLTSEVFIIDESGDAQPLADDAQAIEFSDNQKATADSNGDGVFTVVLDPGHGGHDPGAVGYGLRESDLTLSIGKYCYEMLSKYAKTKVYMTRSTDTFVDLTERANFAKSVGADLFVSLHINSSTASSANGAEIWIPSPGSWFPAFNGVGEELAHEMLSKLESLGLIDRGTMWDNYEVNGIKKYYPDGSWADSLSVIRNCREAGIMAVLVEHGFISNPNDAGYLSSNENLKRLGEADAQAIIDYYGLKLPQPLYGFIDVYDDTPHSGEIGWMAASGVSEGFQDGTFRGLSHVTRQDLAAFLYRLAGSPAYTPSTEDLARFTDVDNFTPHAKEIWWLASNGLTAGFPDGTFRGTSTVARQDMAAFLRRFTATFIDPSAATFTPSQSDMNAFVDINTSTPHAEDIWWLASEGVSTGYSDKTYRGIDPVARQDMSAFLWRTSNLPSFKASSEEMKAFSDVTETSAHAQDIWWLAAKGISTGYSDGTYKSMETVVRQDMAAFLYRLAGSPEYSPTQADKSRFSDVTEQTPHAREIWWMASTGLANGYSDGTFGTLNPVTRADMAVFMRRYYNVFSSSDHFKNWTPTSMAKQRFLDVDETTVACEEIWWLGATGISLGYPDGSFDPTGSVTRQDMAAFLHRLNSRANQAKDAQLYAIMGASSCSTKQIIAYFESANASFPTDIYRPRGASTIEEFARIIAEEATAENVKAEVVFCQTMKETGWLKFGGSVKAEQCNFAGLGATSATEGGASFPDVRTGIRAQVQHLKAYASTEALVNPCVDPRFNHVERGSAPTLHSLNGKWAVPGNGYGESIFQMIQKLKKY